MALLASEYKILKKGEKAPAFSLPATDGKTYSLSDFKGKKAILIIFMCNHCPYVIPKVNEMKRIAGDFKEKGLAVIGINPNEDENYPDDSFDNMKLYSKKWGLNFPYLRDKSQDVARAFGAVCTPDPFLFDFEKNLFYHGQIDDLHGADGEPTTEDLKLAIEALLSKKKIDFKVMPSMGCSIKWV